MRPKILCLLPVFLTPLAHAGDITWNAGGAGTGTDWATGSNWAGGVAPADSVTTDNAFFTTLTAGQPALNESRSVNGVDFKTASGGWNLGGSGTLTVGANGVDATGLISGTLTISTANIVSAAGAEWQLGANDAAAALTSTTAISSNIQLHPTGQLQFKANRNSGGGAGTVNLSGTISNTTGQATSGQVKYAGNSASKATFNITGPNTYTGNTLITQAVVNFNSLADAGSPSSFGTSGTINLVENGSFGTLSYNGTTPATTDRRFTTGLAFVGNCGASNVGNNASDPLNTLSFRSTASIINAGSGNRQLTLLGSNTGSNTFAQSIDNAGTGTTTFLKDGAGKWLLTNTTNAYTGITTLNAGSLGVEKLADGGTNSSIGASTNAAANLVLKGGEMIYTGAGDSTNRLFTLNATAAIRNNGTGPLTFTDNGSIQHTTTATGRVFILGGTYAGVNTFTPTITATGGAGTTGVRFENTTIWELTGTNTYNGTTTINFGAKAQITSDANLGNATGAGQLLISGTLICNETLTLNTARGIYAGSPTAAGTAIIEVAAGKTVTHNGIISDNLTGATPVGADGLSKTGPGTLSLGAANTYTGPTTITAGTLKLGSAGSANTSPSINVRAGATLDLSEKTSSFSILTTQTLSGAGLVSGQAVALSGTVSPGTSGITSGIGTLATQSFAMEAGATMAAQINSAATTSDTLTVEGNLTLNADSILTLTEVAGVPAIIPGGAKLTLATYSGTLTGTFKDRPEGSNVTIGSNSFTLSYVDGNAITLTSANVLDPFLTWINGYTLESTQKTKTADPDGDGLNNATEFLLGGDPSTSADKGKLWIGTNANQLVLSLAIRGEDVTFSGASSPSATVSGISCAIQGSLNLGSFGAAVSGIPFVQPSGWTVTPPVGFSYHSFKLDDSTGLTGKGFLRLQETH